MVGYLVQILYNKTFVAWLGCVLAKRFLANGSFAGRLLNNKLLAKVGELVFLYQQKLVAGALFLLIVTLFFCLLSYDVADPAWSHVTSHTNATATNVFGQVGALLADILYTFLGWSAWALLAWLGLEIFFSQTARRYVLPLRLFAYSFLQVCVAVLVCFVAGQEQHAGVVGVECYTALVALMGQWGTAIFVLLFGGGVAFLLLSPLFGQSAPQPKKIPPSTPKASPKESFPAQPTTSTKEPVVIRPTGVLAQFLASSGLGDELETHPTTTEEPAKATPTSKPTTQRPTDEPKPSQTTSSTPNPNKDNQHQQRPTQDQAPIEQITPTHPTPSTATSTQPPTDDADHVLAGFHIDTAWQIDGKKGEQLNERQAHGEITPTDSQHTQADTTAQISQAVAPSVALDQQDSDNTAQTPPLSQADDQPASHTLDIHDDDRFARQSYAMATAAHRASLSPLPSVDLLDASVDESFGYDSDELTELAELLQIKLQEFNITGTVQNIIQGPIVTSFEVELAAGVRASRVTNITTDLARSLAVEGLRVVEVIPGKPYIGIEISNKTKRTIKLIDLLQSPDYQDDSKTIAMAIGKGVAGEPVIADLAKAPHMLVAGTTGSGKSVFVNSLILSMLLKYRPDELRLVIIDPKEVDFAFYADIPHLLTPIVTDVESDTLPVLSWCVAEMERRYQLMKALRVQKLTELNDKIRHANAQGTPLIDPLWQPSDHVSTTPPKLAPLPFIVIIADEYNDLVKQVGKPLEGAVVRIAQKARAAGIHVIIATQRPSVDVITGIIKSNIPSRVAMYLKNKVDSRTVIDTGGAETLLGNGDMLFVAPGSNQITRVHGAFISQGEITRIAEAWRERGTPDYVDLSQDNGEGYIAGDDTADPLYQEAVAFVVDSGKTSISAIQRKLSIGYNRAANIVDDMQARGILSPPDNAGKRTLLL